MGVIITSYFAELLRFYFYFTKCYLLSDFIIMQNFVAQSYVAYNLLICS